MMDWKEEAQRIVSSYGGKYKLQDCYLDDDYHYIVQMNFKPYITNQSMVSPGPIGTAIAKRDGNTLYITGMLFGLRFILNQFVQYS